jgi:hypothetical protein
MHVSLHLITPIVVRDHDPIYEGDLLPSLINILSITEQSRLIQRECPVLRGGRQLVMKITEKKKSISLAMDFFRFLNPYPRVLFYFWKSLTFGKSLEAIGSRIFFMRDF